MDPGQYQCLLFDADGTLFDYDRAESAALAQVFQLHGLPFEPGYVPAYRKINQQLWLELEQGLVAPALLKVRRFERLLRGLGIDKPVEDFSRQYLECLASCSELMEGAQAVLQELSIRFRLAIVTNGLTAVQRSRVAHSAIAGLIQDIIISEEIGHAKPAPAFFDVAFARLGHPPRSQVLLVGDSWSSDIVGAASYGIGACWYNPAGKPRPPAPPIDFEITSLRQLPGLLGR